MTGLYVSLAPDGKIKRHLSTEKGEIPLSDTNICDELISLTDLDFWPDFAFTKEAMCEQFYFRSNQGGFPFFCNLVDQYLSKRESVHPMYALLTRTHMADSIHNRKNKRIAADKIIECLRNQIESDFIVRQVFDALCENTPSSRLPYCSQLRNFKATVFLTLEDTLTTYYIFRSHEQYYLFLLQQFIAAGYRIAKCQFCGGYFIPRTKRKTLYCDRVIRNGKTCKQIAPYLNRKAKAAANAVISEFDHIKDTMFHRFDRTGGRKKPSPKDLTQKQYDKWLEGATAVRDRYLAGDLTAEEALEIIRASKNQELREIDSAELTLETSGAES